MISQWRLFPDVVFQSGHLGNDLADKSVHSGLISLFSQGLQFVLSTLGTIILARMLTPDDYGLIGMVAVITGFAVLLRDAGLSVATVQQESITSQQISTLFWINLFISFILGLFVLASAPFLAKFYNRPELASITVALSATFTMSGFVIQHQALLRRHMRFGVLAGIRIIAQVVTIVVAIILAWLNWGYWALVVSSLVTAIITMGLTFFFCPWYPSRMRKGTGVRHMLRFGGHLMGFNVVSYFSQNMDNVMIGWFLGAAPLGLYVKAYSLFMLAIIQIRIPTTQVGLSTLSLLRNQPERYIKYYQRLVDILATLTIPIASYCAIEANFLVNVLLGPQWVESVPVFRILAIAAIILPVGGTCEIVLVSSGFSKRYLYWGLFSATILISSYAVGLSYGIEGVATAFTIVNYLLFLPLLFYSFYQTPIMVAVFLRTLVAPLIATILAASAMVLVNYVITNDAFIFHLLNLLVFVVVYIALSWVRSSVRDTVQLVWKRFSVTY
jgi:PST family polysaccharide transporter